MKDIKISELRKQRFLFNLKYDWTNLYNVPIEINGGLEDLVPVVCVVNVTYSNVSSPVAISDMSCQATPRVILSNNSPWPICRVEHFVSEIEQPPVLRECFQFVSTMVKTKVSKISTNIQTLNIVESQYRKRRRENAHFPCLFKHLYLIAIVALIEIFLMPILSVTWNLITQHMMGPRHHSHSQ